jgi:hypothetical protein
VIGAGTAAVAVVDVLAAVIEVVGVVVVVAPASAVGVAGCGASVPLLYAVCCTHRRLRQDP